MIFPISLASPIAFAGPLPKAADVVVIGGGVIGVMTAWYLVQAGQRVVLCEKGRIAGEQSSRNWGWLRQQGRDPAELPIMVEALRLWRGLTDQLGATLGFRQTGVSYLTRSAKKLAAYESWLVHARANGIDTRLLSRRETEAMVPNAAGWIGALHTASDGRAEPFTAVPALARAAAAAGVIIREACAVRGLDQRAGAVAGVITEAGAIACDRVVLAGGAWSSLFLRAHGISIPQLSVLATVAATEPLPNFFSGAAVDEDFAFTRREDGGYTLAPWSRHEFPIGPDAFRNFRAFLPQIWADMSSTRLLPAVPEGYPDGWRTPRHWDMHAETPFERCRILAPRPNRAMIARLQRQFATALPQIGKPAIAASWAGMIDVMPDTVPIVDHTPITGLTLATGMSGHGFGIGPGMARVVADLVMGRTPAHNLHRFRFDRFTDGQKIDLGPQL